MKQFVFFAGMMASLLLMADVIPALFPDPGYLRSDGNGNVVAEPITKIVDGTNTVTATGKIIITSENSAITNSIATVDQIPTDYVPNTRKVNGTPLTQDITIQGMAGNAVVFTNGSVSTFDGTDPQIVRSPDLVQTVNRVKDLHWDPGLRVTWTNIVDNGHIYYVTVTNIDVSAAQ